MHHKGLKNFDFGLFLPVEKPKLDQAMLKK